MNMLRAVRQRCSRSAAAVMVLSALVVVSTACASGSDPASPASSEPGTVETAVTTVASPATDEATEPGPAGDSTPSLPANVWPEEIVETTEVVVGEATGDKDVVTRAAGVDGDGVLPEGVGSVSARVTSPDGEVCEVCLWLADDDVTRQRGLMGVTDLGAAVGMAFVWEQPRNGNFFMFQTPTPLSIAWFDDDGDHVGQADMEPCLVDDSATCERYTAEASYVIAVEMFGGQLDAIGIGPGASIELLDLGCV